MQVMPSYMEECKCISLHGKDIVKICTYLFIPFKLHVVHILFHLPILMPVEYHDALMSSIRTSAFPPYFEDKKILTQRIHNSSHHGHTSVEQLLYKTPSQATHSRSANTLTHHSLAN